jgi:hypothetical protein
MTLRKVGMNLTGFAPEVSRRIYKTLIRTVLEYGTPLAPLAPAGIQALQTAQTHAMRMMLSAPRNLSVSAMHKLLHIEPMATSTSNLVLNCTTRPTFQSTPCDHGGTEWVLTQRNHYAH